MGRLMLNILLSFAQFEREVTGERIRDNIAASKRKGRWMGGVPPLGYSPVTLRKHAGTVAIRRKKPQLRTVGASILAAGIEPATCRSLSVLDFRLPWMGPVFRQYPHLYPQHLLIACSRNQAANNTATSPMAGEASAISSPLTKYTRLGIYSHVPCSPERVT